MSLSSLAAIDSRAIISQDGDTATITLADDTVVTVPALVNRTGVQIDADGLPVPGDTTRVTIDIAALEEAGVALDYLKSGAPVTVTDVTGQVVQGTSSLPLPDRTLGRVTFFLKRSA